MIKVARFSLVFGVVLGLVLGAALGGCSVVNPCGVSGCNKVLALKGSAILTQTVASGAKHHQRFSWKLTKYSSKDWVLVLNDKFSGARLATLQRVAGAFSYAEGAKSYKALNKMELATLAQQLTRPLIPALQLVEKLLASNWHQSGLSRLELIDSDLAMKLTIIISSCT